MLSGLLKTIGISFVSLFILHLRVKKSKNLVITIFKRAITKWGRGKGASPIQIQKSSIEIEVDNFCHLKVWRAKYWIPNYLKSSILLFPQNLFWRIGFTLSERGACPNFFIQSKTDYFVDISKSCYIIPFSKRTI